MYVDCKIFSITLNMDPEYDFDTELTLIYKAASDFDIPANFFLLRPRTEQDKDIKGTDYTVIESLKDVIDRLYIEGNSLLEIYEQVQEISTIPISPEDIAMIYLEIASPISETPTGIIKDTRFLNSISEIIQLYRETNTGISGVAKGTEFDENGNPVRAVSESIYADYKSWKERMGEKVKQARKIANDIRSLHRDIYDLAHEVYEYSPINRKSENITYKGYKLKTQEIVQETVKGKEAEGAVKAKEPEEVERLEPITVDDGFLLFDGAQLSEDVPFVQYNTFEKGNMKSYFKIFRGETIDKEPKYKNIIIPPEEITTRNTLYLKVWFHYPLESRQTPMHLAPASSFITVEYDLAKNKLSFEIPHTKDLEGEMGEDIMTELGVESVSEGIIVKAIYSALNMLELYDREEEGIKADIFIYYPEIDWTTFSYAVSKQPILRRFLYIEESTHPQALKNQLSVRYEPYPIGEPDIPEELKQSKLISKHGLSATIKQHYTIPGASYSFYNLENQETTERLFDYPTPYISLSISRTANIKAIMEFIKIFIYLLPIYMKIKPSIIDTYGQYLTREEFSLLFEEAEIEELEAGELINLKAILPELTKGGFARASQGTHKPKAIRKEDIPEWVTQTFKYHNKDYHKQVLPFPKPTPAQEIGTVILVGYIDEEVQYLVQDSTGLSEWKPQSSVEGIFLEPEAWIVCPTDENPFIGVKENKVPATKDRYPYIPHCYNSPRTNPYQKGAVTGYQRYYLGVREGKLRTKAENILITDKVLKPGGKGELDPIIEKKILNQYPKKSSTGRFYRYGVPQTPNSLLHAVLLALDDPEYLRLEKDELKEKYVQQVRKYLASQIYPGLLKQELYDRPLDEIFKMLCAVNTFLDPYIFYRALEVVFNINIYTYGYVLEGDESGQAELVIPRHKIFHTQPYRPRPTILILRNWGGATDMLEYPQSELIIEVIKGSKSVMVFDEEMGRINYNVLQETSSTIIWKFTKDSQFEAHKNIYSADEDEYSNPDYSELIHHRGQYQILDDYGKMRGLIFSSLEENVTMFFPPSQPVNLPLNPKERLASCEDEVQEYEEEGPIPRCSTATAVHIFGSPFSVTKNQEELVDGLWFGEEAQVYVPVKLSSEYSDLRLGDPNPFETTQDISVLRLEQMKEILDRIQQIIWWLYLVSQQGSSKPRFYEFVENYFTYDESEEDIDSAFYYNLNGIERTFPDVKSVEEAIEVLSIQERSIIEGEPFFHFLFKDGKVWFYNRQFHNKMTEWLRRKVELSEGSDVEIPKVIQDYFATAKNFFSQPFVSVFVGKTELKKWLESISSGPQIHKIHTKITPSLTLSLEPFIFQDLTDGKIYLIQNVIGGSIFRALNVGWTWYTQKQNLGSKAPPTTVQYPHLIYGDSISGLILLEENLKGEGIPIRYQNIPVIFGKGKGSKMTRGPSFYLRLLQYNLTGTRRYAAMLELL